LHRETSIYISLVMHDRADDRFEASLRAAPILGVFRDLEPEAAVTRAEALWDAGIKILEVSLSDPRALEALERLVARAAQRALPVGVGTVSSTEQLEQAAAAGAEFAVAPGFDAEVASTAKAIGLPFLPGVATASDIQQATKLDYRVLKMFPASHLGPDWVRAMKGPFPSVRFVPTGGITASNAIRFMEAGALAVGMGSSLSERDVPTLLRSLKEAGNRAAGDTGS
jgi:2-dehydro-3-deoxyphosphogluconate aldolase / (4S)-4-hydroxy-2-oxoglutarate aldolase